MVAQPYRVIVVEDDTDVAFYTKTALEKRGCVVRVVFDPMLAGAAIASFEPDVVITDIEMPGLTGLDLIDQIRAERPGTPVVVMTAHVSIDYAIAALRSQADEFLTKPVTSSDLISVVTRLGEEFRRARAATPPHDIVLAIGAHPDDVEIGVGGLLAAHRAAGDSVTILTLSRGARGGEADDRQNESLAAAELLGARLFLEDLVDTQISNADPTIDIIERVVRETAPTIVYTHSNHDRHQDHRAVHDATLVATCAVRTVACYQSPSATVDFRPNRFVSIDGFTDAKIALLSCFASQAAIRWYLEPDVVVATARYWSRYGGGTSSEPLEIVRDSADVSVSRGDIAAAVRVEKQRLARDEMTN
ncbi:MAG: response regulator [Microbacteriaceae bacterium]|nr:response regulator [Microbacteriaceae bacterium]